MMSSQSRCLPYEKSIVINALYDAIDALGLSLDSANSMRGTLIVSGAEHVEKMRIALNLDTIANQTRVEVYPEDGVASFAKEWGPVILDGIEGRIRQVYRTDRGAGHAGTSAE